ncbi:MAG: hypothetical protein M3M85_02550 [bacterium]|nr:hypothetical protein [bacterium]
MFKKLFLIFLIAFALNLVWEFSHSVLYESYRSGEITSPILLYVSVMDGLYILALTGAAILFKINKSAFVIIGGLIFAIALELWAQDTGRWVYTAAMPIIPVLNIGLTPVIQLALTGFVTQKLVL